MSFPELSRDDGGDLHRKALTKKVLRSLDIHILPALSLIWLANFIDRTNIGNARIAGLQTDIHLVKNEFNTGLAVFYITFVHCRLLSSNWVLKKMGSNRWLPFLVFVWGIVTTLTGLIQNFGDLVAVRMIMGACEGGIIPGIVLYLSTIYKPHELQLRVGIFFASASLSGAFGGLLASAILKMDGVAGLAGWRWIFILEGIATCVIGFLSAILLPASLDTARFLTEEERMFAVRRFHTTELPAAEMPKLESSLSSGDEPSKVGERSTVDIDDASPAVADWVVQDKYEQFEWREIVRGLTDVQAWLTGFAFFGVLVSLYSYSLFLPTIISGLGHTGEKAQLFTVPPYAPAVVLTVVVAYVSDRYKLRGPMILMLLPITITGYIIIVAAKTNEVRYAAVFLMSIGLYSAGPCIFTLVPNNSSGHYKKATAVALMFAIANTGGFLATFAYTQDQAPRYIKGHSIVLGCLCTSWLFMAANVLYCRRENKARAAGRRQHNLDAYQKLWDSGKTRAPIGDRHPDFRFTL
ncbi:MFS transporter [Artomyces pyxidatus]|uniref:MFS transporter n=1 Tax=Artomyces pyxidatus TaxID=48021 RepID=A0ACB8SWW4_9AGAM|nr:MFS transporter [Artomyces pyxidatus]